MTTIFSNCIDCNIYNNNKNNYEKLKILNQLKLPNEIGLKIIKLSNNYSNCDLCGKSLCFNHSYYSKDNIYCNSEVTLNLCINCSYSNDYGL